MSELMSSLLRAPCCQIGGSTHHMNAAVPRHGAKRIFVFNLPQKWVQHIVLSALRAAVLTFAPSPSFLHQFLTPQQALPVKGLVRTGPPGVNPGVV